MAQDNRGDRFAYGDGQVKWAVCGYCKHKTAGKATCDAFPNGIPTPILRSQNDHLIDYPGDGGIHFELKDREKTPQSVLSRVEGNEDGKA